MERGENPHESVTVKPPGEDKSDTWVGWPRSAGTGTACLFRPHCEQWGFVRSEYPETHLFCVSSGPDGAGSGNNTSLPFQSALYETPNRPDRVSPGGFVSLRKSGAVRKFFFTNRSGHGTMFTNHIF